MEPIQFPGPFMYISTVSSLVDEPFKVKIAPGDYGLQVREDGGYIFANTARNPIGTEILKILNNRDGDPGFSGTYHDGDTDNVNVLKMVNEHFKPFFSNDLLGHYEWYMEDEYDDEYEDEYYVDSEDEDYEKKKEEIFKKRVEKRKAKKVIKLHNYNNIPVLFYLNMHVEPSKLDGILLSKDFHDVHKNIIVWKVNHNIYGQIGVAIQQSSFVNMMGDQMGLAMYADKFEAHKKDPKSFGAYGFGNYDIREDEVTSWRVLHPENETEYYFQLSGLTPIRERRLQWMKAYKQQNHTT